MVLPFLVPWWLTNMVFIFSSETAVGLAAGALYVTSRALWGRDEIHDG